MKRSVGGIFLVMGTAVGAGMLSLPMITAACGFIISLALVIASWSVMYITALKLVDVCVQQPLGVNYTTLIKTALPISLQIIFTVVYLLLLYALMAAYTTQGAALIDVISGSQINLTISLDAIFFIMLFGLIILSTKLSDHVNRWFVSIKLILYILCILSMVVYLNFHYVLDMPVSLLALVFAWPTLLPSFGFQNIIPVLYEYQKGDIAAIKRSILIGSLSVLAIYVLWIFVCLTILPQKGLHSYQLIFENGNSLNDLINEIKTVTSNFWIQAFLSIFINISIVTSFICVGLSLFHYIKDIFVRLGLRINRVQNFCLTFMPPLIFTLFYPKGFILALQYAAIFAVIIFVFTPIYLNKSIGKISSKYAMCLGVLVILAQLFNLIVGTNPF